MKDASFIIRHKPTGQYARFSSYSSLTLVESPLRATNYTRISDAKQRIERKLNKAGGYWTYEIDPKPINVNELEIVRVVFSVEAVEVL